MKNRKVLWAMVLAVVIAGIAAKHIKFPRATTKPAVTTPAPVVSPTQTHYNLVNSFYSATALMYFPTDDGGEKMACTATAFQEINDPAGHGYLFLSASHCVDGKTWVDLSRDEIADGGAKVYYHALVIAQSDRSQGVDASVLLVVTNDHFETIPVGHNPTQVGEPILNVSGPMGAPKQVFPGFISSLYLNRPTILDDGGNWEGYVLAQVPGEGPGSSGSMVVCENQGAACGLTTGHGPGMTVFCPIDRFNTWWKGVQEGAVPARPIPSPIGKALEESKPAKIGKPLV